MAIFGYIIWCVLMVWACAGAFVMSALSQGVSGRITGEAWFLNIVAAAMLFGAFKWFPFTVGVA